MSDPDRDFRLSVLRLTLETLPVTGIKDPIELADKNGKTPKQQKVGTSLGPCKMTTGSSEVLGSLFFFNRKKGGYK